MADDPGSSARIMIVESDAEVAAALTSDVLSLGHTVCACVGSGQDAVARAGQELPDLILMGIALSGDMDGISAAAVIHTRRSIPVIFITTEANRLPFDRAKLTMPLGILVKPVSKGQLKAAIEIALYLDMVDRERRHTEEALILSERYYREIYNNSTDAVAIHRVDTGEILNVNRTLCNMYGYSLEEVLQLTVADLSMGEPPYSQADAEGWFRRTIAQGAQLFEWLARRRNGELFWVEVSLQHLVISGQECILAFVRDISERRRAEEEIRSRAEVERALLNAPADTIFLMKTDGEIEVINEIGARRLGMRVDDVIGCNAFDLLPRENAAARKAVIDQVVLTGKQQRFNSRRGEMYFENTIYPVFNADGEVERLAIFARDITEQKRAEEERRSIESQFLHSQKMESLGLLASGIAHDFNNLLVGIMDNADLAMDELIPGTPARQYVENILNATTRAAELSTQVVTYSKKGKRATEPINLSTVVAEMARLLGSSIARWVQLRLDLASELPMVEANPTQIRQVIMNLIINASQAIGREGGAVRVSTAVTDHCAQGSQRWLGKVPGGPCVRLQVEDTGCGMDEETLARIFDPFFTTKDGGGGLGLAAVLGIVRNHKGAIHVESAPGR
jgi:PAS domain S-box-containing protein